MSYFSEADIAAAMTVKLDDVLPEKTVFEDGIRRFEECLALCA